MDDTELAIARQQRQTDGLALFSGKFDPSYDLPPVARASDPATSHDGAEATRPKRRTQVAVLLDVFRAYPAGLTPAEACRLAGMERGGWKRVSDAKKLGYLTPTGAVRDGGEVLTLASEAK